jgi:AcrR family transcriptional regulator
MELSENKLDLDGPASGRLDPMPARAQRDDRQELEAPGRGAGRPLDENVDEAILNATWQVLLDEGYTAMSIARVAEVARVGRPAIYRRYKDKSEMVRAALFDKRANAATIDTGNAREDLVAYMEFSRRRFEPRLAGTILIDGNKDPELLTFFREGMLLPRLQDMADALERGKERGEVRLDLDTRLAVHALMGAFMLHNLESERPPKGWSRKIVDTLWNGFAATPSP